MLRRHRPNRRAALAAVAATAGLALVASIAPAQAAPSSASRAAAPAALADAGKFAAAADLSLLTLDIPALSPALLPQTNVDLARSKANTESDMDLDADKTGNQRTSASAATTGITNVLGAPVNLQENKASAAPPESNSQTLIPLDLSPVVNLPVIRTTAAANWISDTQCVSADTPLSISNQALADLTLLGGDALPGGGSVLALDSTNVDGAADATAATYLASIPGGVDRRAIQSRLITDITSADVLNDLAGPGSAIHADVVQNPNFTVSASGFPGGASVSGPDPAVDVTLGGQPVITLVAGGAPVDATLLDLNLLDLLDLSAGTGFLSDLLTDLGLAALIPIAQPLEAAIETALQAVSPVVSLSIPLTKTVNPDGTSASVSGALLRVEVLAPDLAPAPLDPVADIVRQIADALGANIDEPLVAVDVAPFGGAVLAPAGGIDCDSANPLRELNKHASALEVAPDGTFEYNIAVPNRGPCVVQNVKVTDVVTGPAGFEIIATEPAATSHDGGTVKFDLGDLAVNQTKNITLTIRVPKGAKDGETFDDVVTVTGTCNGKPISQDDRVDDIPTVRTNFKGECSVQFSNKDASHLQVFPGETFSYYVHAFNSGAKPCSNVTITDTLDARLTYVSCNKSCTNSPADKVNWKLATLAPGSSAILSVVVKVKDDATGTLANSAIIKPDGHPGVTVKTAGPQIGATSIPKNPAPAVRAFLARTGAEVPMGLATVLGGLGLALFALRRRTRLI